MGEQNIINMADESRESHKWRTGVQKENCINIGEKNQSINLTIQIYLKDTPQL